MPRTSSGIASDPEYRTARARKAGRARHSTDVYIRSLVRRASELTEDHRAQLRALLASTDGGKSDA